MADIRLQLDKGLTRAEALRDILKESLSGELVSFRYDEKTGKVNVTTRAFPAFPEILESDQSKLVESIIANEQATRKILEQDRKDLDKREADILSAERKLDNDKKEHQKNIDQLSGERKKFDQDRSDVIKKGLFVGLKSFFHRIK